MSSVCRGLIFHDCITSNQWAPLIATTATAKTKLPTLSTTQITRGVGGGGGACPLLCRDPSIVDRPP